MITNVTLGYITYIFLAIAFLANIISYAFNTYMERPCVWRHTSIRARLILKLGAGDFAYRATLLRADGVFLKADAAILCLWLHTLSGRAIPKKIGALWREFPTIVFRHYYQLNLELLKTCFDLEPRVDWHRISLRARLGYRTRVGRTR